MPDGLVVFFQLLLELWLAFWQYMGGWKFFGPLIIVLWGLGIVLASDSRRDKREKR